MKRSIVAITCSAILAGCSSTPAELEASAPPVSRTYSESYQEIYRRTSSTAKRCLANNMGPYASMAVDSELYSDLGYADITVSLINMGSRNYYLSAKIEKVGTGSRIAIRSGNTLAGGKHSDSMLRWASGDQSC